MSNDIALVRLTKPASWATTMSLAQDPKRTFREEICTIVGWGRVHCKFCKFPIYILTFKRMTCMSQLTASVQTRTRYSFLVS